MEFRDGSSTSQNNPSHSCDTCGAYNWYPANSLTCDTCQIVTAKPQETTQYCVVVTGTNHCKDTSCALITVDFLCNELIVPNAFSPNGDGHNDLLVLHGWDRCVSDFLIMIFDRWGEKVFQTNNPGKSWDGTYKPQESAAGSERYMNSNVFVYYINATLFTGEKITKQGNITIIN